MNDEYIDKEEMNLQESILVSGMYKDWFLDYASYVILERAIPLIDDGLKPVQRRILHSLKELDDGRYHKVANLIGNTMKYHPHGDASIGDAMVKLGQNWVNLRTKLGQITRKIWSNYVQNWESIFALLTKA